MSFQIRRSLCWLVLACLFNVEARAAQTTVLEGPAYRLEFDAVHGCLLSLSDRAAAIALSTPVETAESFRLILEDTDAKRSTILGSQQALSSATQAGNALELKWNGPLTDSAGTRHDVAVTITVKSDDAVTFNCSIETRSVATIVEASYAMFGGLEGFATPEQRAQTGLYPPPSRKTLEFPFGNYEMAYPAQLNMGFMDLNNAASNRGIYMGLHDSVARFKRFQFSEVKKETDPTVVASVVHYPFLKKGETFHGSPVVYRLHEGDWHAGARLYRNWFIDTFGLMDPSRDWIRRESFFQMIMMMLPEGNINYTFKEVPQLARDGLKYGVRSLQLAGWQRGGHDNGYPYYEPDPRLGTWEDVASAIRECHALGVKVYFFANFQPVMMDLALYRDELKDCMSLNSYGEVAWIAGWGMGTLASRMADTVPLMAFADVAFPRMSDILTGYFVKLAQAGADGLHVDKMFPATLDFNPRLEMKPDVAPWQGAVHLMERITRECGAINPEFRMSFESNWDRVLQFSNATWWVGNMTTAKAVFPEVAETIGHYMPYDFLGVNHAVRLGHVVMISPFNFNRSMDVKPWRRMAAYIAELKRIRDGLTDTVFLGEQTEQNQILLDEKTQSNGTQLAVWRSRKDGRRACIFTNDTRRAVDLRVLGFDGNNGSMAEISMPFEKEVRASFPLTVRVPAEGIAFVAEARRDAEGTSVSGTRDGTAQPTDKTDTTKPFENADFEAGALSAWQADPNWRVDNNSAGGWYSGWRGKWFAWSGQGGEQATGKLRSPVFSLEATGVEVWLAGWADNCGRTPDRWNHVTLNLADGTELDRSYAPNSVAFVPVVLSGAGHKGAQAYIEAVDDAPEGSYSMLCVDNVSLVEEKAVPALPPVHVADPAEVHAIENDLYRVEVEKKNGAVRRIFDKKSGIELIREPRLADNFSFTLPIRKAESWMSTEANYIYGRDQRLSSCEYAAESLILKWNAPLKSVFNEEHNVSASMRIALNEESIEFSLRINNQTALEIGEVYYPLIAGTQGIGRTLAELKSTTMTLPVGAGLQSARPFHTFQSMSPFGTLYPEQFYRYPDALSMPWLDLYSTRLKRGVYFAAHDPVARNKTLHLLQFPGAASQRDDGNWPRVEELDGEPYGMRFCVVQIPYEKPGTPFEASPVVLRFHDGDWHAAAEAYGRWFKAQFPDSAQNAIQDSNVVDTTLFPCARIAYAQIPEQAKIAAAKGANSLLLTDWKTGGQNNGEPRFEPDPALGSQDDLKRAIELCHSQGMRVVFLMNLQYIDPKSDWHRDELHRYVSTDRWSVPATYGERRFHMISPAFPEVQNMLAAQTRALATIGADGVHLRDFFPCAMDFNPELPVTPDRASWQGGLACIDKMLKAAREVNPDFRMSTQQVRDRLVWLAPESDVTLPAGSIFKEVFPYWRTIASVSAN